MNKPNTIKAFYHPKSVVADVKKAAGEIFFYGKPKALFEALQKGGWYHSMKVNLLRLLSNLLISAAAYTTREN